MIRSVATLVSAVLLAANVASAQTFDTGLGPNTTFRGSESGPGQGVSVSLTQTVSYFGFYAGVTNANTDLKFQIWNSAQNTILFEQVKTYGPTANGTLLTTDAMSFQLDAGNTYYFALLGNNSYTVSFFAPPIAYSSNGMSTAGSNVNYGPYESPTFEGTAGATMAMAIETGTTVTPEPASVALMASGLAGVAIVARRRRQA